MSDETPNEPIVESTTESLTERFTRLQSKHPRLHLQMSQFHETQAPGTSYPNYQQSIVAPFVDNLGRVLHANVVITLTKAEWRDQNLKAYNERKDQAVKKLLDWVESMTVPIQTQGEDQVKVSEWGMPAEVEQAEQKPKIELTDLL